MTLNYWRVSHGNMYTTFKLVATSTTMCLSFSRSTKNIKHYKERFLLYRAYVIQRRKKTRVQKVK